MHGLEEEVQHLVQLAGGFRCSEVELVSELRCVLADEIDVRDERGRGCSWGLVRCAHASDREHTVGEVIDLLKRGIRLCVP